MIKIKKARNKKGYFKEKKASYGSKKAHKYEWKAYGKRIYRHHFKNVDEEICKMVKFQFYKFLD